MSNIKGINAINVELRSLFQNMIKTSRLVWVHKNHANCEATEEKNETLILRICVFTRRKILQ